MKKYLYLLLGLISSTGNSHAALTDTGGGLVNDSSLNLAWMKDGNLFKTLCDNNINDPILLSYNALTPVRDATAACVEKGRLNWDDAEKFITALNTHNYLGFNDWRQPNAVQPDATCETQTDGQGFGFNCQGGELNQLFYLSLNNPNDEGTGATGGDIGNDCYDGGVTINDPAPDNCFLNTAPFTNAYAFGYWTGTTFASNPTVAWRFFTANGDQGVTSKASSAHMYIWPVRPQALSIPKAVPSLSIWGLILMTLLIGFAVRKKIA